MRKRSSLVLVLALAFVAGWVAAGTETGGDATGLQVVKRTAPVYPPAARAAGFEGSVTLAATVLADGSVGEILVVDSDHPKLGFEQAASDALKTWRFEAAVVDGEPVEAATLVHMHFRRYGTQARPDALVATQVESLFGARNFTPGAKLGDLVLAHGEADANHTASTGQGRDGLRRCNLPPRSGLYDRRTLIPARELVTGLTPVEITPPR